MIPVRRTLVKKATGINCKVPGTIEHSARQTRSRLVAFASVFHQPHFHSPHGLRRIGAPTPPDRYCKVAHDAAAHRLGFWSGLTTAGEGVASHAFAPGFLETTGRHFGEPWRQRRAAVGATKRGAAR